MPIPRHPLPDVELHFQGMMGLFINDNRPYCELGILSEVPGHPLEVRVLRRAIKGDEEIIREYNEETLKDLFSLNVRNAPNEGIRLFRPEGQVRFDRKQDKGDDNDFRWALDFEGPEVYGEPVELDLAGLRSVFTINNGLFFTLKKSDDELVMIEENQKDVLGRVALAIGAYIHLGDEGEAIFEHGGDSDVFRQEKGIQHVISICQVRSPWPSTSRPHPNDSILYDQIVKGGKISGKKIRFAGTGVHSTGVGGLRPAHPGGGSDSTSSERLRFQYRGDPMAACVQPSFSLTTLTQKD